jgi:hypothetical protein
LDLDIWKVQFFLLPQLLLFVLVCSLFLRAFSVLICLCFAIGSKG